MSAESTEDFMHIHPHSATEIPDLFDACIITLRHPHRAMTTAKSSRGKGELLDNWTSLLEQQKKYKTTLFLLIDGPEEKHFPQLMAIAKHFGKEHLEPAIRKYAEDWKPVNQSLTEDDLNASAFAVKAYEQWLL